MIRSIKALSLSFLVGFAMLALTAPEVQGQNRSMRTRPAITPQPFHSNRNGFDRARPFFPPRPFSFDPFLREGRGFDPFLRRGFGFDPFLRREFGLDPFPRRRFVLDPLFGTGLFGFPSLTLTPFLFGL